jgi:hypothetical protein
VRHGKTVNSKSSNALKLRYSILPGWWDYLRKYQRSIEKKLGLHQ